MASAPDHIMDAAWAPCSSSLPFPSSSSLSSFLPPLLFSPALYLCLEMGGALVQPPDVAQLRHLSSLLGTDTIVTLTSYWARFFFYSFIFLSLTPPPPPGTLFSSIPRSFLYTATAEQTPGTLWSKQPASCAVAPSVDSLSREQSVPLLLLCSVLFSSPWDRHSARWRVQCAGTMVGLLSPAGVLGSPQPAWEALSHVF